MVKKSIFYQGVFKVYTDRVSPPMEIEKLLHDSVATTIQSVYRGYRVRKKLRKQPLIDKIFSRSLFNNVINGLKTRNLFFYIQPIEASRAFKITLFVALLLTRTPLTPG